MPSPLFSSAGTGPSRSPIPVRMKKWLRWHQRSPRQTGACLLFPSSETKSGSGAWKHRRHRAAGKVQQPGTRWLFGNKVPRPLTTAILHGAAHAGERGERVSARQHPTSIPPASYQHPTGIPQLRRARDPSHTPVGDTSRHRQGCSRGKTRAQEQAKQERRSIRSNKLLNFHPCPKHLFVSASPGCGRWYKAV